ncbi:response regulator [Methylobacterium sp. J-077]|uniref:response regulator n=1 Tax=Methylobacterium sp. J-077 TaxID=2836656 RepID=UPI001FBBA761|nr:response regulator [Methylobacterium sp. J-077]MCJ2125865.1 response regulator [Methylobacterium sp. J-077]
MPDLRQLPVLVVDDVAMIRAVVRAVLNQIGVHDVHEAPDEAAALAMLNERPYGLVISDWNMFPMSGLELLRTVREDRRLRETLFVVMTTKEQAHAFTAARRAGVNACLIKPFMPAALREVIEDVWPSDQLSALAASQTATTQL